MQSPAELQEPVRVLREDVQALRDELVARITELDAHAARQDEAFARLSVLADRGAGAAEHGVPALGQPLDVSATRSRIALALAGAAASNPVRLATDVGPMLYPSNDQVVMPAVRDHGSWEPETTDRIRELVPVGGTFLDVGAHVGYVSIAAAHIVGPSGHGIAIEPAPENFGLLTANLASAGLTWVTAVHAAAGDSTGITELGLSEENSGDHRAVPLGRARSVPVPLVALDDILPDDHRVHLVKTDTQGTDHRVIRGLRRTIERWQPALLLEYWPEGIRDAGDDPLDVARFYLEMGYTVAGLDVDFGRDPAPSDMLRTAEGNRGGYCTLILTA